jgi:hypothetical protein
MLNREVRKRGGVMAKIPARVADRIRSALKKYQPILAAAKVRDVNESDTVVIVTDLLQDVFGYDKYAEITSEHMIRSTFCDLAIKIDGKLSLLIEVKAVGLDLKDNHIKQAVDYAANQGCDWVGLTNGICWRVYKVQFTKPIAHECVLEIDLLALNPRSKCDIDVLGVIAKEGWKRAKLDEYHEHRQALSRFTLGALVLSDPVVLLIRRELRRMVDVMVDEEDVRVVLREEVLKREVVEGDKAAVAAKQVARAENKALRRSGGKVPGEATIDDALTRASAVSTA